MKRGRFTLIVLWAAVVLLAVFGGGFFVFESAKAAVQDDARRTWDSPEYCESTITFQRVRFSQESWIVLEFDVEPVSRYDLAFREYYLTHYESKWGVREWELIPAETEYVPFLCY